MESGSVVQSRLGIILIMEKDGQKLAVEKVPSFRQHLK